MTGLEDVSLVLALDAALVVLRKIGMRVVTLIEDEMETGRFTRIM